MVDEENPMIIVENLKKSYDSNKKPVLDRINLSVEKGEMIILLGRSGCGKTTLLNMIAGLDRPTSGKIIINGTRIDELSEDQLARFRLNNVGFVFQDYNLISDLTIMENVSLPIKLSGKKNLKKARELLKIFDISGLSQQKANTVSGGEAQRAAIARAMANNPEVLLADEPTGNLDKENEVIVMDYFNKIKEDFNTTIIIATHNVELATFSNRAINFDDLMQ